MNGYVKFLGYMRICERPTYLRIVVCEELLDIPVCMQVNKLFWMYYVFTQSLHHKQEVAQSQIF